MHREGVAEVRPQDDQDALSHVDDIHHAENQREPRRHEGVDRTGQQPIDEGTCEGGATQGLLTPRVLGVLRLHRILVADRIDLDEL